MRTLLLSGDTDSLAPPRQNEALALIEQLVPLGLDIAVTTRAMLTPHAEQQLVDIDRRLRSHERRLIFTGSVVQATIPHLEPPPIPSTELRIEQLARLHALGLTTAVAIRPLLPVVPLDDYTFMIEALAHHVSYALISTWFSDENGMLEADTIRGLPTSAVERNCGVRMDFDDNSQLWSEVRSVEAEARCREAADSAGLLLFDRTEEALDWLATVPVT